MHETISSKVFPTPSHFTDIVVERGIKQPIENILQTPRKILNFIINKIIKIYNGIKEYKLVNIFSLLLQKID